MPTEEHIAQFQQLYAEQFGVTLSYAEAKQQLMCLLSLVEIVYFDPSETEKEEHEILS
jgi:hypothetical protein